MAERDEGRPTDVAAQLRRHLESLRAAGVDYLPAAAPLPMRPAAPVAAEAVAAPIMPAQGLFKAEPEPTAPPAAAPVEDRRTALRMLAEQVAGCTRCKELAATRTQTVFGVGPVGAELCFIGEAPGRDEDAQGEPFVGAAGQLLDRIIAAMGFKRDEVYICNILRCRPPNNRPPAPDEAAHCREWLDRTLELVRPKFLCALGKTAANYLLGANQGISRMRGKFFAYNGVPVMCTFHPSFLLRAPENKREVWEDMKLLLAKMGRPVPSR